MIQTSLGRAAFDTRLRELERDVELRTLNRAALEQRLQHLAGSTAEQVTDLLDGLAKGRYDNPSGWLQALRHLQATGRVAYGETRALGDLRSALLRRPRLMLTGMRFGVGLCLLMPLPWVHSPALSSFLLFFGAAFALTAVLNEISFSLGGFSEASAKNLAGGAAMVLSAVHYLVRGSSLALLAFSWLALLYALLTFYSTSARLVVEALFLHLIRQHFRRGEPIDLGIPVVYVTAQPDLGERFAHRLVAKTARALERYQFRPAGPPEGARLGSRPVRQLSPRQQRLLGRSKGKALAYFLIAGSARRFPPEFRSWLIRNCASFVVVYLPSNVNRSPADPRQRRFAEEVQLGLRLTPGPTFGFRFLPPIQSATPVVWPDDPASRLADVHQDIAAFTSGGTMATVIAPLVQRLSSSVLPMHWADFRLPRRFREALMSWGDRVPAPLGDVALRLRLGQSDVERFLVALEAIELAIKLSAIVLAASGWQAGRDPRTGRLNKPRLTLGDWTSSLRDMLALPLAAGSPTAETVHAFWGSRLSPTQVDLLRTVPSLGLLEAESSGGPATQEAWLPWFVALRNATRGHGVVEEGRIASLWEMLWNVFLEMFLGDPGGGEPLPSLNALRAASLACPEPDGGWRLLDGWLRHGSRRAGVEAAPPDSTVRPVALLGAGAECVTLCPLLVAHGDDVLCWDGWLGNDRQRFQALSYATGKRALLSPVPERKEDVFSMWHQGSTLELRLAGSEEPEPGAPP